MMPTNDHGSIDHLKELLNQLSHAIDNRLNRITLDLNKLKPGDLECVTYLFANHYMRSDKQLQDFLVVNTNKPPRLWNASPLLIKVGMFNSNHKDYIPIDKILTHPLVLNSSIFSMGIINAALQNNLTIPFEKITNPLSEEILKATWIKTTTALEVEEFLKLTQFLYLMSGNEKVLEDVFPALLLINLIFNAHLDNLTHYFGVKKCHELITKLDGKPFFFFHYLIDENRLDMFMALLNFQGEIVNALDKNANNLLHLCRDKRFLPIIINLVKDINQKNIVGNTALHIAASNLEIARFLLRYGADPEIKNNDGKSFWDLVSPEYNLKLYRSYKLNGQALSFPPEIIRQQGHNCGFYAAHCAAHFHYEKNPSIFTKSPLYARKKDTDPKAEVSLRQARKELKIPGQGSIFRADELAKVIALNECKSLLCDVNNYDQFISIIKKAIDNDFPVIIPFSSELKKPGLPATDPKSVGAHWATVIGYRMETRDGEEKYYLLTAQYGIYFDLDGLEMFNAFHNIERSFPKRYLHKKEYLEWEISEEPIPDSPEVKKDVIPETNLENFKKLVIVFPSDYDPKLFNVNETPHPKP